MAWEGTSRTGSWILINRIWKLNMDFGILNLIVMDAKTSLPINLSRLGSFIYSHPNKKSETSRTRRQKVLKQARTSRMMGRNFLFGLVARTVKAKEKQNHDCVTYCMQAIFKREKASGYRTLPSKNTL